MTVDTGPLPAPRRRIRVAIADDHTLFRDGLAQLLAACDFDVVGQAPDGDTVLDQVRELAPDIVILDVQMPGPGPLQLLERLNHDHPGTKVIFLSMHEPPGLVEEAERHGAAAYLRKTAERDVLAATVRAAAVGMVLRQDRPARPARPALSCQELDILQRVAESASNRQIAADLFISESTVKRHLRSAYAKLGVSSRVQAMSRAIRDGLITGSE